MNAVIIISVAVFLIAGIIYWAILLSKSKKAHAKTKRDLKTSEQRYSVLQDITEDVNLLKFLGNLSRLSSSDLDGSRLAPKIKDYFIRWINKSDLTAIGMTSRIFIENNISEKELALYVSERFQEALEGVEHKELLKKLVLGIAHGATRKLHGHEADYLKNGQAMILDLMTDGKSDTQLAYVEGEVSRSFQGILSDISLSDDQKKIIESEMLKIFRDYFPKKS